MIPIYLYKVLLSDFRTYGPEAEIPVTRGPGLTILCGMNGLGKTAFFEAIEWALTGDVRRLRSRVAKSSKLERELSRLGTSPGSHAVELHFTNGTVVKRARSEAPLEGDLVSLLRDDQWQPEIRDVATYLRLTHFLPQSSGQRFLDQEENDQWQLLKGPAGVDRLERFRAFLNDGKARNAFRRIIEELTRRRDEATANLAQFQSMLTRQRDLRAMATAGAALSPQQLETQIGEIITELGQLGKAPGPAAIPGETAAEKLSSVAAAIEAHVVGLQQKSRILTTADRAFADWSETRTRLAAAETKLKSLETELAARRLALEQARSPLIPARAEVARVELEKRHYEQRAETLRRLIEARQKVEKLEPQLSLLDAKLVQFRASLANCETQRNRNAGLSQKRENLLRANAGLRESQTSVEAAMELYARATDATRVAEDAAAGRRDWAAKASSAQQRKQSAAVAIAEMERTAATLRTRLEAEQNDADTVAKAVAEIAVRLKEADTTCPVCAHLHSPGELLRKARESMALMRAGSARLAEKLAAVQSQLKTVREAQESAVNDEADATAKLAVIDSAIRSAEQLRVSVEADPVFGGATFSSAATSVATKRAELRDRSETIASDLAALPSEEILAAELIDNTNALNDFKSEIQALDAQRGALNQQLEQCRAVIEGNGELIVEIGNAVIELENARVRDLIAMEERVPVLAQARAAVDAAERNERAALEEKTNAEGHVAAAKQELAEVTNAGTVIAKTWQDCGLTGDPSASRLTRFRSEFSAGQAAAQGLRDRQRIAVQGFQLWTQNEELRRSDEEIARIMVSAESTDPSETERRLSDRLQKAQAALTHAEGASYQAQKIASELEQKSEEFSTASLKPLTARIAAFNDMISPFGYAYRLGAKVNPTRTTTRQTIAISDPRNGKPIDCDPSVYLSEGQTAALGLSVLFGASMEYRWSRWPALLLDDPLQNTDLIHAAAFIEVIRGLMLDRGFQVIVSTHDTDEADFISRKCQRAKLPVSRVELLSLGPDGLRTRTRTL